jgi:hypothetical protein
MLHRFVIGTMAATIVSDGPLLLHTPEQIFLIVYFTKRIFRDMIFMRDRSDILARSWETGRKRDLQLVPRHSDYDRLTVSGLQRG